MRIGVMLPNWIGDVVMATPALRALRNHVGPAGYVVGVMRPYVADVLAGTNWLDAQVLYDKRPANPELHRRAVMDRLRAEELDQVILLTNSLRTAWMAWRSGARERIGYAGNLRSWLLTGAPALPRQVPSGQPLPTMLSYIYLASVAGCPPEPARMELATTPADEQAADEVWQRFGLPAGNDVVVFNSGGAYGAAKHWPTGHFAELARRIVADGDAHVLVNCGPAERDVAREIVSRAADRRVVGLFDQPAPLGLTKACIRRSRLLVTTDSGPRFFGIAFGKPVVTLFGPTDPQATHTYYDQETCLSLALDCQPCLKRTCPLGHHRCMKELSVDAVHAAVAARMETAHECRALVGESTARRASQR